MITLSYTITARITQELRAIDELRAHILTTALPPLTEARLRWTASRSVSLDRGTLEIIRRDWTGNPKVIREQDAEELLVSAFSKRIRSVPDTHALLRFLNTAKDHPAIVAGIAFAVLHESPMGMLLFWMFLVKSGYDCRGMLAFTPAWDKTHDRDAQYTVWLEEYATALRHTCESLLVTVSRAGTGLDVPDPAWNLTNRHKRILSLFENPKTTLTNRDIQRLFHVSQVTASRDLTHLTALGLLYAHGKGRSVYYTRL